MAIQLKLYTSANAGTSLKQKQPVKACRRTVNYFQVKAVSGKARELIDSGAIRPIPPREAPAAMNSEGFVLLDIRPAWEWEKARVTGSVHVPLFIKEEDKAPVTLLKKWVHFGYIGLWTGQSLTTINPNFVQQVDRSVPRKDTKLLLACGEGLRSMVGAAKLHEAGYKDLGWLAGGFNRAKEGDFASVEGSEELQFATIGGVSYFFLKLLILLRAVGKNSN
ncbi:rhodanese-like domain-containing protein 10 [Malania oleifera]|uniref:rhodanese-like domain-containing protein 10 n=1 Tax=Malania oleifera TaxID=397392 RepID=UPI0025AE9AD1|nr:rhodanese-like domain-containing protein 10 [Malania oleifera]